MDNARPGAHGDAGKGEKRDSNQQNKAAGDVEGVGNLKKLKTLPGCDDPQQDDCDTTEVGEEQSFIESKWLALRLEPGVAEANKDSVRDDSERGQRAEQ